MRTNPHSGPTGAPCPGSGSGSGSGPSQTLDAVFDPSFSEDASDEPQWTPLQLACLTGDLAVVQSLLSSSSSSSPAEVGGLVNAPPSGYYGQTALQAACLRGHEEIVQILLENGADVHASGGNNSERNAFELACGTTTSYQERIVEMLLAAGAVVNPPSVTRYGGRTPLQAASEAGHVSLVRKLLELGADVNAPASTSSGITALQGAVWRGHHAVVDILLQSGAEVNSPPAKYKGVTALQAACLIGDERMVELLLQRDAHVNAKGSQLGGGTALHAAASGGHVRIVERLLDRGADVNAESGWGRQTPLQCAWLIGREDIVELFRRRGATGSEKGGQILFATAGRAAVWRDIP